jgi:MbtH protein
MAVDGPLTYVVVVNDEEQHSVWPADEPPPLGWRTTGGPGSREECLRQIARLWPDIRPRSQRSVTPASA